MLEQEKQQQEKQQQVPQQSQSPAATIKHQVKSVLSNRDSFV